MKNSFNYISLLVLVLFMGCVSKRKVDSAPIKFSLPTLAPAPVITQPAPAPAPALAPIIPQGVPMTNCCPPEQDSMIPFTRDLYNRLRNSNQDIRNLQFFIDQTIILSRGLSKDKLYIENGRIVNQFGVDENKIELPALTPGVIEAIEPDGLRVAFEGGGNNLKFINNKYSPEFFIFSGSNWQNGTAEVPYRGTTYRASCATCGTVSEAKLVIRQKDLMAGGVNTNVIGGRTLK